MNSFYTQTELKKIGFKKFGEGVLISRFARFYSPEKIIIGNNVRIDDFCILSGRIKLNNNIHISAYSALYGKLGIEIGDYSGLSPRCIVFSASDDFGGDFLVSPMVPEQYTNVIGGKVIIKKYVQIGVNSIIMPNVIIEDGVAIGAMSFVKDSLPPWRIYAGNPLKYIKKRKRKLLHYIQDIEKSGREF